MDNNINYMGLDTETDTFEIYNVIPNLVCMSYDNLEGVSGVESPVGHNVRETIKCLLEDPSIVLVIHNASFDVNVLIKAFPEQIHLWYNAIMANRIKCTKLREKLLILADTGDLSFVKQKGGKAMRLQYDLASLARKYLNIDISAGKKEGSWRTNFKELNDIPTWEYPGEAFRYALEDSTIALQIYREQEAKALRLNKELGAEVLACEALRVLIDVALYDVGSQGNATNVDKINKLSGIVEDEMKEDNFPIFFGTKVWDEFDAELAKLGIERPEQSIGRPAVPPRPYKGNRKDHLETCHYHKEHPLFAGKNGKDCDCPVAMMKGEPSGKRSGLLKTFVEVLVEKFPDEVELRYNEVTAKQKEAGETQGNLSVDAEWMEEFGKSHDLLIEYGKYMEFDKLKTSYIPRMFLDKEHTQPSPILYTSFDGLKATGRSSSSKSDHYPSWNGQQVDPRVRSIIVPPKGYLLGSWDFKAMELCTAAQKCFDLFKFSELKDKINANIDVHTYLGAQIIKMYEPEFASYAGNNSNMLNDYKAFLSLSKEEKDMGFTWCKTKGKRAKDMYKHFRTLAKPTGLGYPGGLMPKTFIALAKAAYSVIVSLKDAEMLRELWLGVYPEFKLYFEYIKNNCIDVRNTLEYKKKDGSVKITPAFSYTTPAGMIRSGCSYCACANGQALQSPSAEGALLALAMINRETKDFTLNSPLLYDARGYKVLLTNFIHDELFGLVREDSPQEINNYVHHVKVKMEEYFRVVTPDVKMTSEPALMRRGWYKIAEEVRDENGFIIPWDDLPENQEILNKDRFLTLN